METRLKPGRHLRPEPLSRMSHQRDAITHFASRANRSLSRAAANRSAAAEGGGVAGRGMCFAARHGLHGL